MSPYLPPARPSFRNVHFLFFPQNHPRYAGAPWVSGGVLALCLFYPSGIRCQLAPPPNVGDATWSGELILTFFPQSAES